MFFKKFFRMAVSNCCLGFFLMGAAYASEKETSESIEVHSENSSVKNEAPSEMEESFLQVVNTMSHIPLGNKTSVSVSPTSTTFKISF